MVSENEASASAGRMHLWPAGEHSTLNMHDNLQGRRSSLSVRGQEERSAICQVINVYEKEARSTWLDVQDRDVVAKRH